MSHEQFVARDPDSPPEVVADLATASQLIVRLGGNLYGLPAENVTQVVEVQRPVRVPTAPAHFAGVVAIRGQILAVVALHQLLDINDAPAGEARRLVALDADGQPFAFIADSVLGIREIPVTAIRRSEIAADDDRYPVCGEFDQAEGVVTILEPNAIVSALR